ncbi:MAG: bile acid:sodium symporter [Planctomycetaceae bacterium]|nr:bile acid:sodium symporter [Planctomycetaceae bacterium]MCB9953775.1 bile acid:sodium symporter [Planctomycetaceae bacterium]
MLEFFKKRWFLTALFAFIAAGLTLGISLPGLASSTSGNIGPWSKLLTPIVLFLMSITLDGQRMWAAIRAPGPVLWATTVNFLVIPLLALPLLRIQLHPDYVAGLMIAASVPCTMAAASVWTRKANGNDAVSMLTTIATNGLCFIVTPIWLSYGIGKSVEIDTLEMMLKLLKSAFIPIVIGQLGRLITPLRLWADKQKTPLGVVAQSCILLIVLWAAFQQGAKLADSNMNRQLVGATLLAGLCVVTLHLVGMAIAYYGGRALNFRREDVVALTFAGSQKTLPIGIYVATELLRDVPFAVYAMLMYHAMQLVVDTILLDTIKQWRDADHSPETALPSASSD